MKRTLLYLLLITMIAPSCKKGEEDPYLSLRTRKNRLVGYWQLQSFTLTRDFGDVVQQEFDPGAGEMIFTFADSTEERRSFTWEIEFDREGSYRSLETERFQVDSVETPFSYTQNRTEKGDWEFTGGNGEPRKSQLLLLPSELSSTRSDQGSNIQILTIDGQTDGQLWNIDRLANEELWISYEVVESIAFLQEKETVEVRLVKLDGPPSE